MSGLQEREIGADRSATMIVARSVAPGNETECEDWLGELRRAAERAPGFLASSVHPPQPAHPGEWLIVYTFDNAEHLDAWLDSPHRARLLEQGRTLHLGAERQQRIAVGPDGVALVSAVRVAPGRAEAHRALHESAVGAATDSGGLLGAELLPAIEGVQPDTVAIFTFTDRGQLERWLNSPERAALLREMEPLLDGDRTVNVVNGFGGWFHPPAATPERWKQATLVLLGLIPVSLLVTASRTALVPTVPMVPAVVVGSVVNVLLLTWIVMPLLTRRFAGWLGANDERRPALPIRSGLRR